MSDLRCDEFVELVTDYLDGALDAGTRRRFTDHLAECDGCEQYLEQIRVTVRRLGVLREAGLTGVARDRLLAAFCDWHRG